MHIRRGPDPIEGYLLRTIRQGLPASDALMTLSRSLAEGRVFGRLTDDGLDPVTFTDRQLRVLDLVSAGVPDQDVARRFRCREATILRDRHRLVSGLGASSFAGATGIAIEAGLLPVERQAADYRLSPGEAMALGYKARGFSAPEIAEMRAGPAPSTVNIQLSNAYAKLGCPGQPPHAVRTAYEAGILPLPGRDLAMSVSFVPPDELMRLANNYLAG